MSRHLLLEGASGVGKTTLILHTLGSFRRRAGGFVTQRMADESGFTKGFCLTPAGRAESAVIPYRPEQPGVFLLRGVDGANAFAKAGFRLLEQPERFPFLLLDEIGGIELLNPAAFFHLGELFFKTTPILSVLKSVENCERMIENGGAPGEMLQENLLFRKMLAENPEVELLSMNRENRDLVKEKIVELIGKVR
ncbi:nucleoside-triphosphatase [Caproicibacter sp.]|uniref:nucleoside-triphosphatase n=1 Tax=Caproicibacter sp. TaxID=2814884 RepID=UPI00398A0337